MIVKNRLDSAFKTLRDGPTELASGMLGFRCNICGGACLAPMAALSRETSSCAACGSTVRMRGMVHALSLALFNQSLAIPDFPERKDIVGKGMSDWDGYALPLAQKLSYTNTYYHKEPHLDIMEIGDTDQGSVDFLLSTDVFEHVAPPVLRGFANARAMLRGDAGALVFSVPYAHTTETVEHFPNLHAYAIEERDGQRVLVNRTQDGQIEEFTDLVFHGGEGDTLEMRVFSETGLLEDLAQAGFGDVRIVSAPCFEHGIYWPLTWGLPMIARVKPHRLQVVNWGPQAGRIGAPANRQADGRAAIWLKLDGSLLGAIFHLSIGDLPGEKLAGREKLITAVIPESVMATPGRYPVVLTIEGEVPMFLGDFLVYS